MKHRIGCRVFGVVNYGKFTEDRASWATFGRLYDGLFGNPEY